jgi:hypothetical protein
MKILILGGYGVFGGRLAQLLADCADLTLLISGRDLTAAQAFCDAWQGVAKVIPLRADRAAIGPVLAAVKPDLLVDASGPFQNYGPDPYAVLRACIAAGVNYLDFADGADFVAGVAAYDQAAKQANVFALSGVSSFPVLTAAVLREAVKTMQITQVRGGIAPSPYAGVGANVMRAVLGYAGSQVALMQDGQAVTRIGIGDTMRYTIAPPGELPLRNTLFSLVEVPDLQAIPQAVPDIQSLWMGAGPVPEVLHRLLILLAKTRAALHLPNLSPLAPLCYRVLNAMRFGEHRGGMFIEAKGLRDGQAVERVWHMLAEGDVGPLIPSMACEAIVRHCLHGNPPLPGARSGIDALSLADYEARFAGRAIVTGWRDAPKGPIYRQVLGDAFNSLPGPLQDLHQPGDLAEWRGRAVVQRGKGWIAGVVAGIFGFPTEGRDVPISVRFRTDATGMETWQRNFDGRIMVSTQEAGQGKWAQLIVERFGPFAFGLALVARDNRLYLIPRRWSFFGLPLPKAWMPKGDTFESEVEGQFHFHVEITLPLIGRVVCYDGGLNRV